MIKIKNWINDHGGLITNASAILVAISLFIRIVLELLDIKQMSDTEIIAHIVKTAALAFVKYWEYLLFILLAVLGISLAVQYRKINKQLSLGFEDKLDAPINKSWDFEGAWSITQEGDLYITNSERGGLSKKGAFWENYEFSFEANLLNDCLGVIVRAQDLNNYFMVQITADQIRPHLIKDEYMGDDNPNQQERVYNSQTIKRMTYIFPDRIANHRQTLNKWFKCLVTVKGLAISMKIEDIPVFNGEMLPLSPSGKVGFRNFNHEAALVKNIKVRLI